MRPVKRGAAPTDAAGNPVVFAEYKDARDPLIKAIGDYCSYCENALHSSIDIEHVQPKKGKAGRPDLELVWDNFLLACDYCNPIKGHQPIVLDDYFWPDRDNTFQAFMYVADQPPAPADGLTASDRETACRTLELTGLDRVPGHPHYSDRDRRFGKRKEAWGVALLALQRYRAPHGISALDVALMAVPRGFFSIWMTVFREHPEVRQLLLREFKAADDCFWPNADPKPRPGGRI